MTLCLSDCLSQVGIISKRLGGSSSFLAQIHTMVRLKTAADRRRSQETVSDHKRLQKTTGKFCNLMKIMC